jgi:hypothetical protein
MTPRSTGPSGIEPAKAINAGIALAIAGVLVPTAASIDPWLLVLVAGLTVFALTFRRSDFDFDFDF